MEFEIYTDIYAQYYADAKFSDALTHDAAWNEDIWWRELRTFFPGYVLTLSSSSSSFFFYLSTNYARQFNEILKYILGWLCMASIASLERM